MRGARCEIRCGPRVSLASGGHLGRRSSGLREARTPPSSRCLLGSRFSEGKQVGMPERRLGDAAVGMRFSVDAHHKLLGGTL